MEALRARIAGWVRKEESIASKIRQLLAQRCHQRGQHFMRGRRPFIGGRPWTRRAVP
jgi:hypothetical protein